MKRLIVGLGNPGTEYAETRHNAGFMLVDALADRLRVEVDEYHDEALSGRGHHRGCEVVLSKPTTYVNRSGGAVRRLLAEQGLAKQDLLVAVDDLNLDVGAIRLRSGGGSGGHNGLESIAAALGTTRYPRLRIGIGSAYERGEQVEYVLAPFSEEQTPALRCALETAREAALCFVVDGIEEAMNQFN